MPQSKIQYQAGLSLAQFTEQYGTESQCEAAVEKARWPEGGRSRSLLPNQEMACSGGAF
jgi:hypothetical protein